MIIDTLITDRTYDDVALVKEILGRLTSGTGTKDDVAIWNSCILRGSYNYKDLNRVITATKFLSDKLNEFGYANKYVPIMVTHPDGTVSEDWRIGDIPNVLTMDKYLKSIETLRSILGVESLPTVPDTMRHLDIQKANAIERLLKDEYTLLLLMQKSWFFSGELFSGEV